MIRVVLADDHSIVRQGLRNLLEDYPVFNLVGEASDGIEAIRLTESLRPDVLVLDLKMKGLDGIEVARRVATASSGTVVVVLSMLANEAYVVEALRAGAKAYVVKDSTAAQLVTAINEALEGRRYLSPPLSERAIESYMLVTDDKMRDPLSLLTAREREVLYLTSQGQTSGQIADSLSISRRTAETHRANVMRKLGVHNKGELIRYVMDHGLPVDG